MSKPRSPNVPVKWLYNAGITNNDYSNVDTNEENDIKNESSCINLKIGFVIRVKTS